MFAYCRNNPVIRKDASGTDDIRVTDANEDGDPLNDYMGPGGAGGGGNSSTGTANGGSYNGVPGRGYPTMREYKSAEGSAPQGQHLHHIVEQSQIQKSGFSPEQIHNTNNIIPVDAHIHAIITGHYNSVQFSYTNGLSVRNWLVGQPFHVQYAYGLNILRECGVI